MSFNFENANEGQYEPSHQVEDYSVAQLLALRAEIDAALPATELGDLNLDQELVRQYLVTQALQTKILADSDVPANQQAQVLNACAGILENLQKTQEKFYRQERFKKIELALIKVLRKLPEETVAEFMEEYERTLGEDK